MARDRSEAERSVSAMSVRHGRAAGGPWGGAFEFGAKGDQGFVCPETMMCRPKAPPGGMKSLVGWFHHLHSGEEFGPVGTAISLMTGLALLFFSISGLWMYFSMWKNRKDRSLKPGWFWK